jgi:hypothetical protein
VIRVDIVLILCMLGVIALGYAIVGRIDKFLNNASIGVCSDADEYANNKSEVLIYPSEGLPSGLLQLLLREGIGYCLITEPSMPDNSEFSALIAISGSDLDNLLLCSEAKYMRPATVLFARCNDSIYLSIFEKIGINRIFTGKLSADELLLSMKGLH